MSTLRLMSTHWEWIHAGLELYIKQQEAEIVRIKNEIADTPVEYEHTDTDSVENRIYTLLRTLNADYAYKDVHPNCDIQGGKSAEELLDIINGIKEKQREISAIEEKIVNLHELAQRVEEASKGKDSFLDRLIPRASKMDKPPGTESEGDKPTDPDRVLNL